MPIYVSTANPPSALEAAAALDALEAWGFTHAVVAPGRRQGKDFAHEAARWGGRLVLHDACLEDPAGWRWNLAARDEDLRRRSVARAAEAMRVAADAGSPFYSLNPGHALEGALAPDGAIAGPPQPAERALDQLCRSLDALASRADDLRLALLVKNGAGGASLWQVPEAVVRTLDRLAAPPLGLLLDVGHALVASHARRWEPEPVVAAMAPYARAVAVSRNDGVSDAHAMPVEGGVELALARLAGGSKLPVLLETRGLDRPRLEEAVGLLGDALRD